jgi:hypothetical protein
MITPSFFLTATERVLPKLALDWTIGVAQSGVDVVRASALPATPTGYIIINIAGTDRKIPFYAN